MEQEEENSGIWECRPDSRMETSDPVASGLGNGEGGQARKGTRWMPRHQEATKDVAGCEKYR